MRSCRSRSVRTRAMSSSSFAPLVKRAVDRERIALRVPPPLMAFLRGSLAALRASLQDVKDLELVEDPSLPAGGCVIESRFGEVDIGVETQLERCERAVRATE